MSLKKFILFAVVLLVSVAVQAGERKTYDDWFTPKSRQAYSEDINVWVYTSGFAKRFGMPERWVDDSLKGAYAVAFRVETLSARKMFPHKGPDASMPNRRCILDIFIDDKAPIPWVDDRVSARVYSVPSAPLYLRTQNPEDRAHRRRPVGLPVVGDTAVIKSFKGHVVGLITNQYDKNLYPGVTYISFNTPCMTPPKTRSMLEFRPKGGWSKDNRNVLHRITLPEQFMQRLYVNWYEKSRKPASKQFGEIVTTPTRK